MVEKKATHAVMKVMKVIFFKYAQHLFKRKIVEDATK
jgi:hypothetical protein